MRPYSVRRVICSAAVGLAVVVTAKSSSSISSTTTTTTTGTTLSGRNSVNSTLSNETSSPLEASPSSEQGTSSPPRPTSDEDDLSKEKPKKKKKGKGKSKSKSTERSKSKASTTTKTSATLTRIKKEYKDAVEMGIAYDWVRQRQVRSKKKKKKNEESSSLDKSGNSNNNLPLCLGPLSSNLKHWHFSFRGCGIYEHGVYHGLIILPKDYPGSPPRVQLWTPSGRFIPGHDICLSASAFHPESWTPRWTILSLVQALRLHMLTNPQEIGGIVSNSEEILEFAKNSLTWKVRWQTSAGDITVDHAKLLDQGAVPLQGVNEEEPGEIEKDRQQSDTTAADLENGDQAEATLSLNDPSKARVEEDTAIPGDEDLREVQSSDLSKQ